jgi:hypothetical protein
MLNSYGMHCFDLGYEAAKAKAAEAVPAPPRLLELAREQTKYRHDKEWALHIVFGVDIEGHSHRNFESCPHPDCVLVRAVVPSPPTQSDKAKP